MKCTTPVTDLDLDVSITLDLSHNRIYINFRHLAVIFERVSALISTEWWLIFYLFIYKSDSRSGSMDTVPFQNVFFFTKSMKR